MSKVIWRPGNMLYPLPAVMVTVADKNGNDNIITVAWAGTVCSDPAMVSISVKKSRFSHHMLLETGEFAINLVTKEMAYACDLCGVKSGRDVDKWAQTGLTREKAEFIKAPLIKESPVSIECKVTQVLEPGSHDIFLAKVLSVDADERYIDEKGRLDLAASGLISYIHGGYYETGKKIGGFGFSVRKKSNALQKSKM